MIYFGFIVKVLYLRLLEGCYYRLLEAETDNIVYPCSKEEEQYTVSFIIFINESIFNVVCLVLLNHRTLLFIDYICILQFYIFISEWVKPICVATDSTHLTDIGQYVTTAGWGFEDVKLQKTSSVLKAVSLPIVDMSVCVNIYK